MNNTTAIKRAIKRVEYKMYCTCNYCHENKEHCNNCSERDFYYLLIHALENYKEVNNDH